MIFRRRRHGIGGMGELQGVAMKHCETCPERQQGEAMKWEYLIAEPSYYEGTEFDLLNRWGKDGWELVSIVRHLDDIAFYFKRPLPDEGEEK